MSFKYLVSLLTLSLYQSQLTITNVIASQPNVIIFMADDLGIGDVGCYGNNSIKTPNIDLLAREGVRFTQALSASPTCTPSRSAFLTGKYPIRSGMVSSGLNHVHLFIAQSGGLPKSEETFAKALKRDGYATALIGKWHLGISCSKWSDFCHHPNSHGFDHFYGMPLTNLRDFGNDGDSVITAHNPLLLPSLSTITIITALTGIYLSSKSFKSISIILFFCVMIMLSAILFMKNIKLLNSVLMRNKNIVEQPVKLEGLTQRYTAEAIRFIENQASKKKPFLLFLSYTQVHTALATHPTFVNHSVHGIYGDNVEELDWSVGEILKSSKNLNIDQNTLYLFTSDNGAHLEEITITGERAGGYNGQFRGGKAMGGMEGGIRVPTIIKYAEKYQPSVVDVPVSLMDFYPTVMGLRGKKYPGLDGKDLAHLLTKERIESPHRFLFHYCNDAIHAVRWIENVTSVWKVHFFIPKFIPGTELCNFICHCYAEQVTKLDPPMIYNIQNDPYERKLIDPGSLLHKYVLEIVEEGVKEHNAGVKHKDSQFTWEKSIWKPWLQPCCDWKNFCTCQEKTDI